MSVFEPVSAFFAGRTRLPRSPLQRRHVWNRSITRRCTLSRTRAANLWVRKHRSSNARPGRFESGFNCSKTPASSRFSISRSTASSVHATSCGCEAATFAAADAFEISEPTRESLANWMREAVLGLTASSSPSSAWIGRPIAVVQCLLSRRRLPSPKASATMPRNGSRRFVVQRSSLSRRGERNSSTS